MSKPKKIAKEEISNHMSKRKYKVLNQPARRDPSNIPKKKFFKGLSDF